MDFIHEEGKLRRDDSSSGSKVRDFATPAVTGAWKHRPMPIPARI